MSALHKLALRDQARLPGLWHSVRSGRRPIRAAAQRAISETPQTKQGTKSTAAHGVAKWKGEATPISVNTATLMRRGRDPAGAQDTL